MKNKLLYCICLIVFYQISDVHLAKAQERTVTGKVSSIEDNEGLLGVNVV